MKTLVVRIAMLSMALILLAACGSHGAAATPAPVAVQGRVAGAASESALVTATIAPSQPSATSKPSPEPSPTTKPSHTPKPADQGSGPASSAQGNQVTKASKITFAVIGDDGTHGEGEKAVADMVKSWKPDFIIDTGDAYYNEAGGSTTDKYDQSVGSYFCDFVKDVTTVGKNCPHGNADINRFFPTLGNHDYSDAGLDNYLKYFDLPGNGFTNTSGNKRYYDFRWGPVHFYTLNSNPDEPDGRTPDSKQGQWLKDRLSKSRAPWQIVFFHHPPYTSAVQHSPSTTMQWPFKDWGVTAVFNGHEHVYERLLVDGEVYFVNGLGGGARYSFKPTPATGSQARVSGNYGAQKVTADDKQITFEFYTVDGKLADTYTIKK